MRSRDVQTPDVHGVPAGVDAGSAHHEFIRTSCGRLVTVGRLNLSTPAHPAGRVTLHVGCEPHDHEQVWMSLTPDESRRLAQYLLAQAAAADLEAGGHAPVPEPDSAVSARGHLPTGQVEVVFVDGETYAVHVRGHHLLTDQPIGSGGNDMAATPTELLVASLASCVAFYSGHYLSRHGFSRRGLRISAQFDMAKSPARVGSVRLRMQVPAGLPAGRSRALQAVASHCTVHNTLRHAPKVDIEFALG